MDNSRCRLCLDGLQENNSVALKDFETNMLKALLPELDLGISIDPKICDKCIKLLVVCYEFKTTWLENNVKEKNVSISNETSSVQLLCCLCREHIFEELGSEDLTEWKEMADKCVPELDIFSSKNITSCKKCVDDLTNVYMFLDKVIAIEANIKTYFSMGVKQETVNLSDVFTFFYSLDDKAQSEHENFKPKEELKSEIDDICPNQDVKPINKTEIPTSYFSLDQRGNNKSNSQIVKGNINKQCNNFYSQNDHAPIRFYAPVWFPQKEPDVQDFKGGSSPTLLRNQNALPFEDSTENNADHAPIVHEDEDLTVAVPWFSTDENETSNQEKNCVDKPTNENGKKTPTKRGDVENKNSKILIGRKGNPKLFYCDKCSYTAKWKSALVSHLMRHKSPSETPMFRCEECGHETKRKADLRFHMIVHKDPAEVKQFKCPHCPYASKRNGDLKQHLVMHSTKALYKCQFCQYQTANKRYFTKIHSLVHKDKSELKLHKCPKCPYGAKVKTDLKRHLLTHMNESELEMFKCNWCPFQSRFKGCLRKHMLIHKDLHEIQLFECYTCGYKGKRKKDLKCHLQTHRRDECLHCDICPFKTYQKRDFRKHLESHRNVLEVEVVTCGLCGFQTRRRADMLTHMRRHIHEMKQGKDEGANFRVVEVPPVGVVKKEENVDEVGEDLQGITYKVIQVR